MTELTLRERIEAGLARHARWEAEEARKVLFVPADPFYVDRRTHQAAVFAVGVAAQALGITAPLTVRWFRRATRTDREADWPPGEAFRALPEVGGYVDPAAPTVVWLNLLFCQCPPGAIAPSLQAVAAHETQHAKDLLQGRGVFDREYLELKANVTAHRLVLGEPVPH